MKDFSGLLNFLNLEINFKVQKSRSCYSSSSLFSIKHPFSSKSIIHNITNIQNCKCSRMDLNNLLSKKILKVQNSQYCPKLWLQLPLPFYYTQYTFGMSVCLFMCLFVSDTIVSNKDKKCCLEIILIVKNLVKKPGNLRNLC